MSMGVGNAPRGLPQAGLSALFTVFSDCFRDCCLHQVVPHNFAYVGFTVTVYIFSKGSLCFQDSFFGGTGV
jgi:hypothetical protein